MASLSYHCLAKALTSVSARLPIHNINGNNNSPSSKPQSSSSSSDPIITVPLTNTRTQKTQVRNTSKVQKKLQKQLTFIQLERSIGAGSYRDTESTSDIEKKESILQGLIPDSDEFKESSMEKKLRETGEWVAVTTEREFQSSGKSIVMFVFRWVLPVYVSMFSYTFSIDSSQTCGVGHFVTKIKLKAQYNNCEKNAITKS